MFRRTVYSVVRTSFLTKRTMATELQLGPISGSYVLRDADMNILQVNWRMMLKLAFTVEDISSFQRFMDCSTPIDLIYVRTLDNTPKDRPRTTRLLKFAFNTVYEIMQRRMLEDIYDPVGGVDLVSSSASAVDLNEWGRDVIQSADRCRKLLMFKTNVCGEVATKLRDKGVSAEWIEFTVAKYKEE